MRGSAKRLRRPLWRLLAGSMPEWVKGMTTAYKQVAYKPIGHGEDSG